ncbi:hypothetical protein [Wolbachia endosymbiont of Dactylopius coccus]
MALRSKLLDEKVVESAKEMLKKVIPILIVGHSNRIHSRVV